MTPPLPLMVLACVLFTSQMASHNTIAATPSGLAGTRSIGWEVANRFRVIQDEDDESRFYADVATYITRIERYRGPVFLNPFDLVEKKKRNYRTHWNSRSGTYDEKWLHDPIRRIRLSVNGADEEASCIWELGTRQLPNRGCSDVSEEIDLRNQPTAVKVEVASGQETFSLHSTIEIHDIWIVGLGDSYASGEGNPHVGPKAHPAVWWDSRCHRSLLSGQALAAAQVARRTPSASVTFLSFACSGAEITGGGERGGGGMLTGWAGRESIPQVRKLYQLYGFVDADIPPDQYPGGPDTLRPQMDQMKIALGNHFSAPARPDYVIISVGGNDIGFGRIASDLLLPHPLRSRWVKERCPELKTALECYQYQTLSEAFKILSEEYQELYAKLHDEQIRPKTAILTESPNIVMAGSQEYCTDNAWLNFVNGVPLFHRRPMVPVGIAAGFSGYGLSPFEARFADIEVIKKLNEIGKNSMLKDRVKNLPGTKWAHAAGIYQRASEDGRGYCTKPSWFLTVWDSLFKQGFQVSHKEIERNVGTTGILHPNVLGHCEYANDILTAIGIREGAVSACDPSAWVDGG